MPWIKGKSLSERAENEQAKLQMKQIKLAQMQMDSRMRAEKEKMQSAEMRRLRA